MLTLKETKAPDVKETYEIGKEESEVYTNKWPSQAANPSFKPAMLDFYTQCHNLQLQVMSCLALSLGLDKNFFEQHCNGRDHNLRLLHYPAVPALQSGEKKAETNRAGAHTDYGTVTLLFQDDVGGLEVLTPSGTYVAATPIPGTIVINAGDLLSRWSNNLIVSTEHRVVSPPGNKDGSLPERYSIAFFSNPNQDAVIEALPGTYKTEQDRIHKSIRTHEYLTQRLSATVGDGPASATRSQVRKYSTTARDYSTTAQSPSSVSADEISHFDTLAATWWDPNGTSGLLHKMNPARIGFIRSHMVPKPIFSSDLESVDPLWLSGKKTLDVGCGGGLLSEALSRVGADITGVDASSAGITVAKEHARQMGVQVEYLHTSAEELAASRTESYDVVCAMEILEHVSSPASFLKTVMTLLKPGGMLFISTIEKTQFAKFLTCTIAEDILRLVPKGTHNYDKFIPKEAIKSWMSELGGEVIDTRGIIFDPLAGTWRVLNKGQTWGEACNYIMAIKKAA